MNIVNKTNAQTVNFRANRRNILNDTQQKNKTRPGTLLFANREKFDEMSKHITKLPQRIQDWYAQYVRDGSVDVSSSNAITIDTVEHINEKKKPINKKKKRNRNTEDIDEYYMDEGNDDENDEYCYVDEGNDEGKPINKIKKRNRKNEDNDVDDRNVMEDGVNISKRKNDCNPMMDFIPEYLKPFEPFKELSTMPLEDVFQ